MTDTPISKIAYVMGALKQRGMPWDRELWKMLEESLGQMEENGK